MKDNQSVNTIPIKTAMKRYFEGQKVQGLVGIQLVKFKFVYNYSAMTTNVIMNYVIYKTGDDWEKLLHKIFTEDAKVKNKFIFIRH